MPKQPRSKAKATTKTSKKSRAEPKKVKKPKAEKKISKIVKKKTVKKTVKKVEKRVEETRPRGPLPMAIVYRTLGSIRKFRRGRGFSRPELHAVGLDGGRARKLGLRVDLRRSTEWSKNVDALKKWFTTPKAAKTVKKATAVKKARVASKTRK
ncbi:MAG: ribosomal protein L13e [Nitrososphaerales archaeon]